MKKGIVFAGLLAAACNVSAVMIHTTHSVTDAAGVSVEIFQWQDDSYFRMRTEVRGYVWPNIVAIYIDGLHMMTGTTQSDVTMFEMENNLYAPEGYFPDVYREAFAVGTHTVTVDVLHPGRETYALDFTVSPYTGSYRETQVPEAGSTVAMLGLGMAGLFGVSLIRRH